MDWKAMCKANPRLKESFKKAMAWQKAEVKIVRDQADDLFTRNEKRLFASEGASGGSKWPGLDPKYAEQKAKRFPGRKIMQRTGAMRKAFVNKRNAAHVATYTVTPRPTVTLGADSTVAAYHVAPKPGMPNPLYNRHLPDRDVMQMTQAQEQGFRRIVQEYQIEKIKRAERILKAGEREFGRMTGDRRA